MCVVALAFACGSKHAPAPPVDCDRLVTHLVDLQTPGVNDLPLRMQTPLRAAFVTYRATVVDSCKVGWPADAIACVTAATSVDALDTCSSHFTAEQQKMLSDAYAKVTDSQKPELTRWLEELKVPIDKMCGCSDAACRSAAQHDYDAATAEGRKSVNADVKQMFARLDGKLADCAKTDCDEVFCTLDGSTPCCQRLAKTAK